jgi:hypothetical protein
VGDELFLEFIERAAGQLEQRGHRKLLFAAAR